MKPPRAGVGCLRVADTKKALMRAEAAASVTAGLSWVRADDAAVVVADLGLGARHALYAVIVVGDRVLPAAEALVRLRKIARGAARRGDGVEPFVRRVVHGHEHAPGGARKLPHARGADR